MVAEVYSHLHRPDKKGRDSRPKVGTDASLRAVQAILAATSNLGLQKKHCYSTEIDPNLVVVDTDVEHVYIFTSLTKQTTTHDFNDPRGRELQVATICSGCSQFGGHGRH